MKRIGGIWEQVVSFENLLLAYRKARRGKGRSPEVARFTLDLEQELLGLQRELRDDSYRPGPYRLFQIYERKPRTIAAAPFRDRVVHHAVMNLIEPPLDRTFIADSYACRRGKGVHAAVDRYQHWARRHAYALKMDVAQYFPSIDHQLLKAKLERRIKDRRVLALLVRIIDTSPAVEAPPVYFPGDDLLTPLERPHGIPIGNLTSQFLANLFLDGLDHSIKQDLRVGAYLRYVDDMVVLDNDKARLADIRAAVRERLHAERLLLHPRKAHISPTADGLNLLGYLVFPNHRRLRNDNGHRFSRRLRGFARAYAAGRMTLDDIEPSIMSWIGHARHADTWRLRARILSPIVFRRGTGQETASAWCAAVPGTTNRRTSARPTATGTTPTTGTTTSASVSPSPPARVLRPEPGADRSTDPSGVVRRCP
jgi:RNA-directed DNA polymerase